MLYKKFFKRFIDIIISFSVFIIVCPFFILISLLIKLESKGNVFFLQKRLGKRGILFNIYKFRTMYDKERNNKEEIYKGNVEVTKVGVFLRRFKIDELPQLINVMKGDLSIVGPRPILPETLKDISTRYSKRSEVLPGLTGLAQINGNIYLDREERFKLDVKYVEQLSFMMDLKIIFKTFFVVLLGEEKFLKS